jgi:BirA family biotin operon repressor/biotin-[acetyl-CoA-carboxylase] ligase
MILAREVFRALADGGVHSGEALAETAGVTRSAVWKAIEHLREMGLAIEAQTNRGYRLVSPCEALDAQRIQAALAPSIRHAATVDVEWEIDSTNGALLSAVPPPPGQFVALLAENQTGGRGRRGRAWQSALGSSLCLSVATTFEPLPRDLPALTLVIGVCVREALRHRGAHDLALKWPNDIVTPIMEKLGGILVELRAEAGGPGHVVIGVGLNLRLSKEAKQGIAETGTLAEDLAGQGVEVGARNTLAAEIIGRCIEGLMQFADEGFAPFIESWRSADALRDQPVRVFDGYGEREGVARGIDDHGALQIETSQGQRIWLIGGEVSVRREGRS